LTYQAEKTLKDLGDKVSAEDRAEVETKVASLREALKGDDLGAVRSGAEALVETLSRVSTAAYQAAAAAGEGGAEGGFNPDGADAFRSGDGDGAEGGAKPEGSGEETVEGEFKEV
ncbi:MAG: molecular chaperone DnaK, partial [Chloroflexi bacterium]|nr:molecular chaperone DnaK [Chloroflexota bacterium]